ncbi:MAG TPA: hypothetical protein VGA42_09900, partial [Gemmatimonadales bacterium]
MRPVARLLSAAVVLAGIPGPILVGQSLQRLSVQGSGALVFPTAQETEFQNGTRLGWEGQLRYTFSRFSLGAGYQYSTVYKLQGTNFSGAVSLGFLEPRYVAAATSRLALYGAGRAGLGSLICDPAQDCEDQSLELVLGGGGGVLVQASRR